MRTLTADESDWNGLCDLRPLVVGYLGRFLRDDAEIEDTAQETLMRAARFRLYLTEPARLRPWVLRIALNVLRDRRRRENRLPRAELEDTALDGLEGRESIPGDTSADGWIELSGVVIERSVAFGHLAAAMSGLEAGDRGALSNYYRVRSDARGRADRVCDAPRVAVRKHHVFRARKRLTRALLLRFALDDEFDWPAVETPAGDTPASDVDVTEPGAKAGAGSVRARPQPKTEVGARSRARGRS